MHVKQPVKKYFEKKMHSSWMRTDRQLTVAKPNPPLGISESIDNVIS